MVRIKDIYKSTYDLLEKSVPFKPEEEIMIFKKLHETEDEHEKQCITEEIIIRNTRLVIWVVNKIYNPSLSLDYNDLYQEGVIGLIIAINKFDPKKGNLFSTYAVSCIRSTILRAIQTKNDLIRLPAGWNANFLKIKKLFLENPCISNEEISKELDLSLDKVEKLVFFAKPALSLDAIYNSNENHSENHLEMHEILNPDHTLDTQSDFMDNTNLPFLVAEAINSCLNEKERDIILLRFGIELDDSSGKLSTKKVSEHTLREIAKIYGVSHEYIRIIEKRAIKKLTSSILKNYTQDYLD